MMNVSESKDKVFKGSVSLRKLKEKPQPVSASTQITNAKSETCVCNAHLCAGYPVGEIKTQDG